MGKCKSFPSLFVSIVKASQPIGSCSLFNQGIFGTAAATPGAGTWGADGKNPKYETQGSEYPGGSGSLTGTADTAFAATDPVTYKYDQYSIDGIYFLNGTLKMKSGAAATGAIPGTSAFEASEVATLTLSETAYGTLPANPIAEMVFDTAFNPTFTSTIKCGVSIIPTGPISGVTIKGATGASFTEVVMAIKTAGTEGAKIPEGTNVDLLLALIGPKYS